MTTPTTGIEELHSLLNTEAEGYQQLLALTRVEQTALKEENLVTLTAVTQDKQAVMDKLARWEQAREKLVSVLAAQLNLPPGASMLELIAHLDEAVAARLLEMRNRFINMVELLLTLNHGNRLMLQTSLARVEATFDYLSSVAAPPDGSYTAKGSAHTQNQAAAGNMLNWHV
jgi:flagellar biosynthesis/type III secretory pathway chaperone